MCDKIEGRSWWVFHWNFIYFVSLSIFEINCWRWIYVIGGSPLRFTEGLQLGHPMSQFMGKREFERECSPNQFFTHIIKFIIFSHDVTHITIFTSFVFLFQESLPQWKIAVCRILCVIHLLGYSFFWRESAWIYRSNVSHYPVFPFRFSQKKKTMPIAEKPSKKSDFQKKQIHSRTSENAPHEMMFFFQGILFANFPATQNLVWFSKRKNRVSQKIPIRRMLMIRLRLWWEIPLCFAHQKVPSESSAISRALSRGSLSRREGFSGAKIGGRRWRILKAQWFSLANQMSHQDDDSLLLSWGIFFYLGQFCKSTKPGRNENFCQKSWHKMIRKVSIFSYRFLWVNGQCFIVQSVKELTEQNICTQKNVYNTLADFDYRNLFYYAF